jgi:RNA polymerase sigma-70 factor (ECF subfamily)
MITTKESLLDNLKADNAQDAWREFYRLYWGAIVRYASKLGLNQHQAEEVLQETMVALMRILPEFAYDRRKGKFRNFLLTIVHRKSLAMMRRVRRTAEVPLERISERDSADPFSEGEAVESEALNRWREAIREEALKHLQNDPALEENTFAIFKAYVLDERPAAAVAAEFGLKENAVYQIKNRLLRRLQCEVAQLMRASGAE